MDFLLVRLAVPAGSLAALADFYGTRLGLDLAEANGAVGVRVGLTPLEFGASERRPFYHFALLMVAAGR